MINVALIPVLEDNYAYLITGADGTCAILDPGDAPPIIETLDRRGQRPAYILNTHHHYDHTDGNLEIKERYGCPVIGPALDAYRIPGIDQGLSEGEIFMVGPEAATILHTPGHTRGHICFYFTQSRALFCGDVLFAMSCGRLFEGTPEQMWTSFQKIAALPDDTLLYCGHEYTLESAEFCLTIEPDNEALRDRYATVRDMRARGEPTLPTNLALEKATNAMLRAGSAARFGEIRLLKDRF